MVKQPLLILFHWRPLAFISGLASVTRSVALTHEIYLRRAETKSVNPTVEREPPMNANERQSEAERADFLAPGERL